MRREYMGVDNSFEQEVEPIQRQLENRFHPLDGSQLPQGMQGMNSGFNVMPQVPMVVQMQSSNP